MRVCVLVCMHVCVHMHMCEGTHVFKLQGDSLCVCICVFKLLTTSFKIIQVVIYQTSKKKNEMK